MHTALREVWLAAGARLPSAAAPGPPDEFDAAGSDAPMAELVHTILLVTWFTAGQPASSYHVEFSNARNCEAARSALMAARNGVGSKPELIAVCVPQ